MTVRADYIDHAVQETRVWIKLLMVRLPGLDSYAAHLGLRATLHALRDRIGPEQAVHFGAQLPTMIRGIYYEGWKMSGTPTRERHKAQFLDHVRGELTGWINPDVEALVRSVFEVLWLRVDQGEIAKIVKSFPEEVRELWQAVHA
jgi:uncharacterized protein (DUF2267 family)